MNRFGSAATRGTENAVRGDMACVDTTVLIDLARSPRSPLHRRAAALLLPRLRSGEMLCTTRFNEAELLVGVQRAPEPPAELAKVRTVLSGLVMLDFNAGAARLFAAMKAHLFDVGRPAGDMTCWSPPSPWATASRSSPATLAISWTFQA